MKKYFVLVPALLLIALPVSAADFVAKANKETYSVGPDSLLVRDLYAFASQISISGNIQADATIAGQDVFVSGQVTEDLTAAAKTLNISGVVGQDLHVAGQTITISGTVHGDVVAAGETLIIEPGAVIEGDLLFFGSALTISGEVKGEIHTYAEKVTIEGGKTGSIWAHVSTLTLSNAHVSGEVTYTSDSEFVKDAATVIDGKVTFVKNPIQESRSDTFPHFNLLGLITALLMVLLAVWLFAAPVSTAVASGYTRPVRYALIGVAALIAAPIVGVMLMCTLVGLPLGILMLCLYGALIVIAIILKSIFAGALLSKVFTKEYKVTYLWAALGVVALTVAKMVPVVGWIPGWAAFLVMFGFVVLAIEHLFFPPKNL